VRHLTRPHQPGASRRDPARLARTSRRNTSVATSAPRHALHQDERKRAGYQPGPDPDSGLDRRKIPLAKPQPAPAPSRLRNHLNRAKVEIPINRRRSPAGSCMGGFRTPAPCLDARPAMPGIRKPSPKRTFPGCRHEVRCWPETEWRLWGATEPKQTLPSDRCCGG